MKAWFAYALMGLLLAAPAHATPESQPSHATSFFRFVAGLKLPSVKGKALVRVWTGSHRFFNESGRSRREAETRIGYLLRDSGAHFEVLHGLDTESYQLSASVRYQAIDYEPIIKKARVQAKRLGHRVKMQQPSHSEGTQSERLRFALLSYGAQQSALPTTSAQLFSLALTAPGYSNPLGPKPQAPDAGIMADLGFALLARAIKGYHMTERGTPLTRQQLREHLLRVISTGPQSEPGQLASQLLKRVTELIKEDDVWQQRKGPQASLHALKHIGAKAKARPCKHIVEAICKHVKPACGEYRRQLQSRRGVHKARCLEQLEHPNALYDLVMRLKWTRQRATASDIPQLVYQLREHPFGLPLKPNPWASLGLKAVPPLLDQLDNERPTRQVVFQGSVPSLTPHWRVALKLLSQIAQTPLKTPQQARKWWSAVKKEGHFSVLARAFRETRVPTENQAKALIRLNPKKGLAAVIEVAARTEGYARNQLVKVIVEAEGKTQIAFLKKELTHGSLKTALAAAQGLIKRRQAGWVRPLQKRLTRALEQKEDRGLAARSAYALSEIIALLINKGGKVGKNAINASYGRLGERARVGLLHRLAPSLGGKGHAAKIARGVYIKALASSDMVLRTHVTGCRAPAHMRDIALSLSSKHHRFKALCSDSPRARDRASYELLKKWRADAGMPPLAPRQFPSMPPLQHDLLKKHLTSLEQARLSTDVDQAITALRKLGPAVVPHLMRVIKRMDRDHPGLNEGRKLAQTLSLTVKNIFLSKGLNLKALERLKGQPFIPEDLISTLSQTLIKNRQGRLVVEVHAHKEAKGITLRISALPPSERPTAKQTYRVRSWYRYSLSNLTRTDKGPLWRSLNRWGWNSTREVLTKFSSNPSQRPSKIWLLLEWTH